MAESKILKEIANNEITIDKALKRLMILANDLGDEELATWADNELSGYGEKAEIPEYRKIFMTGLIYSGINGRMQVKNIPLPMSYLGEEIPKILREPKKVGEPIANIIEKANSQEQIGIDVTSNLADTVYNNTYDGFFGVQCTSITIMFDRLQFAEIIQKVSQKLLKVFIKLDKEYGNLDALDIDMAGITQKKIKETSKELRQIIFENITINNNDFSNAKLKASNVIADGENNKQTNKQERRNGKKSKTQTQAKGIRL